MKSDELVRRINNGEIKDGTKIKCTVEGCEVNILTLCGRTLKNDNGDYTKANLFLIEDAEFEIVEEHKGWFKPNDGEWYWCINSCGVLNRDNWDGGEIDLYRYNHHNCFRTQAEAQEYLDYMNALKEAEKPFEVGEHNYHIAFDVEDNELWSDWDIYSKNQGVTYLGQYENVAQAFIDKWKDCILKYEFDVLE